MHQPTLARLTIGLVLCFGYFTAAVGDDSFPYQATISRSSTVVHSAPSKRAYATEIVDSGTTVEVYRHDPGGWCAVRPPSGSFSLIPRSAVDVTGDRQVGKISRDGVKAWIGTRISHRDEAIWQVTLQKGELVEILDIPATSTSTPSESWVLIAPPAGEFRWVHEKNLHRETAPTQFSFPDAPTIDAVQPSESQSPVVSTGSSGNPSPTERPSYDGSTVQGPTQVVPVSAELPADDIPAGDGVTRSDGFVNRQSNPTNPTTSLNDLSSPAELLKLGEETLSRILLEEPGVNPQSMKAIVVRLDALEIPASLTDDVEKLKQRFARYELLAKRKQALAQAGSAASATSPPRTLPPGTLSSADPKLAEEPRRLNLRQLDSKQLVRPVVAEENFAVKGKLNRLIRSGGLQASGYAIQDELGAIQAMIVAAPGVNLERYLKQNVGIQGSQSRHPRYNIPVVLAERVIKLDRHRFAEAESGETR